MTAVLEIDALSAGYGGVAVVRDLTLTVEAGEVVALLGPNGAGKSTTLLAVSGLVDVVAGDVRVQGTSVVGRRPHRIARSGVAHVPEDRSLFPSLTVRENLRLAGSGDVDRAVALFPVLGRLLDRRAGLLSGGEQQMLAIARAVGTGPRLLMIDEMSLGLAPVVVERLLPIVRTIAEETGAAVLFVEQHVGLALELADRAYVVAHGDLVLSGPASDLRDDPDLIRSRYLGRADDGSTRRRGSDAGGGRPDRRG